MSSDHLYHHSKPYALLKEISSFYHSVYYENICIKNVENIPLNEPVIFTPTHQNGLMDALAVIYSTKKQPVFLARADIFTKNTIKKILNFLKIIPVYRIRDGVESLSNNDNSFELAFQVLKNKGAVCIMPEGNHGEQRRLRPLKKGVARLGIQSQELLGSGASIKIVPVGIEYSDYYNFRSNLLVIFGKPIDIKDYLQEYSENAAKGLQSIRSRLVNDLSAIMINIDSDNYYDTIYEAKELYSSHNRETLPTLYDKFVLDKKLSDKLVNLETEKPEQLNLLKKNIDELNTFCNQLNIKPWVLSWKKPRRVISWFSEVLRYLFFLPFFGVAALFHLVPYIVSEIYANKVDDKQLLSSARFALNFILYTVWYIFFLLLPVSSLIKLGIIITMPVLGVLAYDYWDSIKKLSIKFRYLLLKNQKNKTLEHTQNLYSDLITWLSNKVE
jgi:1-acyl-sn-glycerol-3-phosphate acyltransferase